MHLEYPRSWIWQWCLEQSILVYGNGALSRVYWCVAMVPWAEYTGVWQWCFEQSILVCGNGALSRVYCCMTMVHWAEYTIVWQWCLEQSILLCDYGALSRVYWCVAMVPWAEYTVVWLYWCSPCHSEEYIIALEVSPILVFSDHVIFNRRSTVSLCTRHTIHIQDAAWSVTAFCH